MGKGSNRPKETSYSSFKFGGEYESFDKVYCRMRGTVNLKGRIFYPLCSSFVAMRMSSGVDMCPNEQILT